MTTRRRFLSRCLTGALAGALAPSAFCGDWSDIEMKDRSLDDIRFSTFARQASTTFRVIPAPGKAVDLRLIEAAPLKNRPPKSGAPAGDAGYEKFSLLFAGEGGDLLEQRIYKFEHSRIGRFEMFITAVASSDGGRRYYQAVFNRPAKGAARRRGVNDI